MTHRTFRFLASLLLMLGILAGSDLTNLHAQKPGDRKDDVKKEDRLPEKNIQPPPQAVAAPPAMSPGFVPPFQFTIDPKTPLKDLLPPPPKTARVGEPVRGNDLSRVPEVRFEAPQGSLNAEALKHIAHQIAKINHLNDKKTDGFIEALRSERPDLHGLPFAMGDACRTKGERSKQFALAVAMVRQALQSPITLSLTNEPTSAIPAPIPPATSPPSQSGGPGPAPSPTAPPGSSGFVPRVVFSTAVTSQASADPPSPETFWDQYQTLCPKEDKSHAHARRERRELITLSRIAALSQILMPMAEMHPGFVKYLSTISHVEATQALARLAIFSQDEEARKAAIDALKVRRERDYTDILVNGLRYPWPAVAHRAAEAIVKLERSDLLPQLLDVLEQPDPRAPVMGTVKGKRVPVVREMVRLNHHRSCLLCHAPGNTGKVSGDAVRAEVPVSGQPLNSPSGPYNASRPDILVRVDVTYLRQDFSVLQAVADANPWPEMQRFDFLVRTRVLTEDEAAAYREKLKPREQGEFSPYQRAVLAALRELTGRDTEPTPEAWRRLLKLPRTTY